MMKSRGITVLLALLCGGLGIHKFYLNKPGIGLLYMLFVWTFIPSLIAGIEALIFIFMSDEDFDNKYNMRR